ncbi:glycoside hydrolase [Neurospora hispaniola]|uniref:beta-glucosidase n=1 Tax=Neurospora hispaniola TaxID=588809 RepID=A0AAJ0IGG7_9PEZI|nr:glycoside hydrolase [Neurospora hispaniola]
MASAENQKVNAVASTGEHVSDIYLSRGSPPLDTKSGGVSWITRHFPFLKTKRGIAIIVAVILVIIGAGIAGLATLPRKGNKGTAEAGGGAGNSGYSITSDEHFYGQSPPVYPSPNMTGTGAWASSYKKAKEQVGRTTLDEKLVSDYISDIFATTQVHLTTGLQSNTSCSGFIRPISRIGFPGMCLSDAGNGLRNTDFVSSWSSGLHVGASWNKSLAYQRGTGMGSEFNNKGVNVLLGPVVGPMGRVVLSGRNWEGFSSDPYLAGALVYKTVEATQNVGNIMCSYNRLNNSYGCANSKFLNGLLKTELGFEGFVVSDWSAQHAGVATALAGLDMTMPERDEFWGSKLVDAVKNGSVPESRVYDMVTRIMASWYKMGQDTHFPTPGIGMVSDITKPHMIVDARNSTFRSTLFDGAVEGHVLVKNTPIASSAWVFGAESFNYDEFTSGFFGSAAVDGTALFWDFHNGNPAVNPAPDACLVIGNTYAAEGADRPGARNDYTDRLIKHVADQCNNTIVVFYNAGIRLALVSLLYGDSNPSSKLSLHHCTQRVRLCRFRTRSPWRRHVPQISPEQLLRGRLLDYRHFDAKNITPRFESGFGLSYTTFSYGNLSVKRAGDANTNELPTGEVREGGQGDLSVWDTVRQRWRLKKGGDTCHICCYLCAYHFVRHSDI